jgi:predicted metal-binding protein
MSCLEARAACGITGDANDLRAMGVVSCGGVDGTRAVEQLRLIAGELQLADVHIKVALSPFAACKSSRRSIAPKLV